MALPRTFAISPLPQEIINFITDEVANQRSDRNSAALVSLRACSLVSKYFRSQSLRHIFSSINIVVGDSDQYRASSLLKPIQHRNSDVIVQSVRSLQVTFNATFLS
ncbi:hypothetical protein CPB84DRAFT_1796595 [Gymnopilus junonius]|uniref:F-box domain-containing protein n=1 Tax=Gymnopilus junonius TaxID=109634 RepID=A0A9P5TFR3_GYMJU|nr:hypothetical protein CPB84DRAFT_1796595 [Gymnopilus junonius]